MSSREPHYQLPDHVRRIIDREGETEFTPPSFERWLGRLQMLRTMASMGAFMLVWLVSYTAGIGWEGATIRSIAAALAFHFFAWAVGLFIFGELYDIEVKQARVDLEVRERERARRIESYYRERLRAQGILVEGHDREGGHAPGHTLTDEQPASVAPIGGAPAYADEQYRPAA
ncbi:MAG: hypothetical protein H7287_11120 [Thermoleophilia bacterium]|nr:hypothetical protein [Thermoleophilia bacterium]